MTDAPPTPAFWASMFDALADSYDQSGVPFFGTIAEGLVRRLAPAPGEHALDLGAGRGAATLPLADAVGAKGSVRAVDLSERMVALLAEAAAGLPQVKVEQGDATAPPDGPFDLVSASLVLFFIPDPVTAVARWRDVLAPGGRLGISTFAPWPPVWEKVEDLLRAYHPADARAATQMPDAYSTDAGVAGLFADAGFADVRTERATYAIPFADIAQWRSWSLGTAMRGLWREVPGEAVPEVLDRVEEILTRSGNRLDVDIRYTLGSS